MARPFKTDIVYREQLKIKHKNKIDLLEKYTDCTRKHLFLCKVCKHKWLARPDAVLAKTGCSKCSNKEKALRNTRTPKESLKDLKRVHGNSIAMVGDYVTYSKKITVKCRKLGHVWTTAPGTLISGVGCSKCQKIAVTKTNKQFISELKISTDNTIKCLEPYINAYTKLKFKHKQCGYVWSSLPTVVASGKSGCPKCNKVFRRTDKEFKQDLAVVHSNNIKCLDNFVNGKHKLQFYCNLCDFKWYALPLSIITNHKHGCPNCAFHNTTAGFKRKSLFINGHNFDRLQGYEPRAIEDLVKHGSNVNIIKTGAEIPTIRYKYKGQQKVYHPDILIKKTMIEVKSDWFFIGKKEWFNKIKAKALGVIKAGYRFKLMVYNSKKQLKLPNDWLVMPIKQVRLVIYNG